MVEMAEKEIRGGICRSLNRYAEADNKCMKYENKKINCQI